MKRRAFSCWSQKSLALLFIGAGLLWFAACIPAPTPKVTPMGFAGPQTARDTARLAGRVKEADGFVTGVIVKIEEDDVYDEICGILANLLHRCDGTVTYSIRVEENGGVAKWFWVFVPSYGYMPLTVGQSGTFIYKNMPAFRYKECRERSSLTSAYCRADRVPVVRDSLDIVPLADSQLVSRLFSSKTKITP